MHTSLNENQKQLVYLLIGFQVIVENVDRNSEITSVEWINSVPALRTEFSSLRHDGMEIAKRKQNALKFDLTSTHFQRVLDTK